MRKKNFLLFFFLTIWNGNVMLCVLIYYYDVSSNENFYFHLQSQPLCSVYAQYRTSHTQIEFSRSSNRSSGKKNQIYTKESLLPSTKIKLFVITHLPEHRAEK